MKRTEESDSRPSTLYYLTIVEENSQEGLVKMRYMEYGKEHDECRLKSKVVNLSGEEERSSGDRDDMHFTWQFRGPLQSQCLVFQELVYRIKALLTSSRKGNPSCYIIMSFDQVSFNALALHCSLVNRNSKCKCQVYKVQDLSKLNDLLRIDGTLEISMQQVTPAM